MFTQNNVLFQPRRKDWVHYAVHFSLRTYSLDTRSRGGNVEIPDMKTAYAGH
jgi:hypothetical protein